MFYLFICTFLCFGQFNYLKCNSTSQLAVQNKVKFTFQLAKHTSYYKS